MSLRLVRVERPRHVVALEFGGARLFAGGASFQAIAAELERDDVAGPFDTYQTKRHSRLCWTPGSIRAILSNPAYLGRVVWKQRHPGTAGARQHHKRGHVPESAWVVADERQDWWHSPTQPHAPIVDARTWDAVARSLAATKPRHRAQAREPFFLSGLLTCATCGSPIVGGGGSRAKADDPGVTMFYRCRAGNGFKATCAHPALTVGKRWLEAEVVGRISAAVVALAASGKLAAALDRALGTGRDERRARANLEAEQGRLAAQ